MPSEPKTGRVTALDAAILAGHGARFLLDRARRAPLGDLALSAHFALGQIRDLVGRALADGDPPPAIATLAVTSRCAMKCLHCSQGGLRGETLPRETMLEVVDALVGIGTPVVAFTGGEPFMCEHLLECVDRVRPPSAALVFSSGWGLDREAARRLSGRSNLSVMVSLDATDPAEHDRRRGREGAHERAVEMLGLLAETGVHRGVSTVVTRDRIRSGELERFLMDVKGMGVDNVQAFGARPVGEMRAREGEVLDVEDEELMADLALRTLDDPRFPFVLNYPYLESAGVLGCCGGSHRLYMDARGEICPCDFNPVTFGNVRDEPVVEIWRRMRDYWGPPRDECFVRRNCGRLGDLEGGRKASHLDLEPREAFFGDRAPYVWDRYGPGAYRFFVKYMYFMSAVFPRLDPRFDGGRRRGPG